MVEEFGVISAIRYDPSFLLPSYVPGNGVFDYEKYAEAKAELNTAVFFLFPRHVYRLNMGYEYFWPDLAKKQKPITDEKLAKALYAAIQDPSQCWRLRPRVNKTGEIEVEANIVPSRPNLLSGLGDTKPGDSYTWTVYVDTEVTPQSDITKIKTTNRDPYTAARERVFPHDYPKTEPVEVLLYNEDNQLTEGSLTNVAFYRNGEWITPASDGIGGLRGAVKAEMLARGFMREYRENEAVFKNSLQEGEKVLLMNGIQGVFAGYVTLKAFHQ
ncbi:aminotransferase class IV-domain-containing protein [Dipodascopsis uninucleata]